MLIFYFGVPDKSLLPWLMSRGRDSRMELDFVPPFSVTLVWGCYTMGVIPLQSFLGGSDGEGRDPAQLPGGPVWQEGRAVPGRGVRVRGSAPGGLGAPCWRHFGLWHLWVWLCAHEWKWGSFWGTSICYPQVSSSRGLMGRGICSSCFAF